MTERSNKDRGRRGSQRDAKGRGASGIVKSEHTEAAGALGKYTFENCPSDYGSLKDDVTELSMLSGYAFVLMAQRLVRTLCPHCKSPTGISDEAWRELVHPWKAKKPEKVYEPVGCLECRDTGYQGRMGIYEMFKFSDETRLMITKDTDIHDLRRAAIKDGLQPLRLSGANKVAKGETTVEEVLRVAPPPLDG